jgi:hypothetical protein
MIAPLFAVGCMPLLGRFPRYNISSHITQALLEKLECELGDMLMHLCPVNSLSVAAYL